MALYNLENAIFTNGVLTSGTWTPRSPKLSIVARESSKNRYTQYPIIIDDIEGTGTFIEVTRSITRQRVALTEAAATILQAGVEGAQFQEPDGTDTSGRMWEDSRIVGSYIHEYTVSSKETRMVDWVEGQPGEEDF
jgi:hypothetical protein